MYKVAILSFLLGFTPIVLSKVHVVKKNETLMTISYRYYGTHQCWDVLVAATPILNGTDIIEIGDKIIIPHYKKCNHQNATHNQMDNGNHAKSKKLHYSSMKNFKREVKVNARKIEKDFPIISIADKKRIEDDEFFRKLEQKVMKAKGEKSKTELGKHNDDHILNAYLSPKSFEKKLKKIVKARERKKVVRRGPRNFTIQLGAFPSVAEAQRLLDEMTKYHFNAIRIERADLETRGIWYRVRIGHFFNIKHAKKYAKRSNLNAVTKEYYILKKESISKPIFNNAYEIDSVKEERILDELKEKSENRFNDLLKEDD